MHLVASYIELRLAFDVFNKLLNNRIYLLASLKDVCTLLQISAQQLLYFPCFIKNKNFEVVPTYTLNFLDFILLVNLLKSLKLLSSLTFATLQASLIS